MIPVRLACGLLVLVTASAASAQVGRGAGVPVVPKREEARKALSEATKVLERARSTGDAEARRVTTEDSASTRRIQDLAAAALKSKDETPSSAEKAQQEKSDAQLSQALATVAPEGQVLLAQSTTSAKPQPVKPSVLSTDSGSARPAPLRPTPLDGPAKSEPARTTITAVGPDAATFFDSKEALGVFTGDVEVTHPQFHLTCDVLEIYMVKETTDKKTETIKPASPTASELVASDAATTQGSASSVEAPEGSNIKQAIAKGRKVVIEKLTETGDTQIGICRHATYIGATGDMIMRNMPQVQRGTNLILATDPSTVMTILANGQLKVNGPATTKIVQAPEKKKGAATTTTTTPGGAPQ